MTIKTESSEITHLLQRWAQDDSSAIEPLIELTYGNLEQIARNHLRSERRGHTLQTAALINEAFIRMCSRQELSWESRRQFFAFASETMRRVLVDHARAHLTAKRGSGVPTVALGPQNEADSTCLDLETLLSLHAALEELERESPELCRLVVMKYFGGLRLDEIATFSGLSKATVKRKWTIAKKRLARDLRAPKPPEENG